MTEIGFIGLGQMGFPMISNLIKAGHSVVVYDISEVAMDNAIEAGAKPAATLKELAAQVEIAFTMLQSGEQVKQVCLGRDGIFQNMLADNLYIDCSSIDVKSAQKLHAAASDLHINMLDAPVSGGVLGAKDGTLTFMVGGTRDNFIRAETILSHLGKKIIYVGAGGNGQVAKICNNMLLGISMLAASEAFTLAQKLGLDAEVFFKIVNNASGQCWSVSKYCPFPGILKDVPSSHEYKPGFAASMMLKDLRLSQEAASQANASTPLGAQATALYAQFVQEGNSNVDFSGIIKML